MQVIVDKHTVTIVKNEIVNEGEYNVQSCNFQFSSDYDGLPKIAIFKTNAVTKQIMLSGNTCITPEEVLQTTGIVGLGVYAYQTDGDNLILRYSPTPAVFTVEPGSYDEGDAPTPPTPSVIEQLQEEITQNANNITSLENVTDTHTTQIGTLQTDVNNIKTEQITQNTNIQTNANDISNIKAEQITQNNKIAQNTSDIATLNNNLTNYSLITETGSQIVLNVNPSNYQMTAILKDKNGNTIYTSNVIDLPIESMIVNVTYDSTTKEIVFTLQNGTTLRVSVADLVSGLVSTDELNTILASYYTKTEIDNLLSGKVDTTTYTQGQATQDANIEENASNIDWLQILVNQMPTVSGQGTDLSLESVLNYRLMKFLPQGSSSQFSTTGNNLLENNLTSGTENGITYVVNADKSVTLNGTATAITWLILNRSVTLEAGTYTMSSSYSGNDVRVYSTGLGAYTLDGQKTITKTTSVSGDVSINIPNGTTCNNLTIKPMIQQGSTATSYEPYTGGIPAPNPSYPYPVKSVTGNNSLVISNSDNSEAQTYPISLGNIELNSSPDGTIRDQIVGKPNEWYKREYIGKKEVLPTDNISYDDYNKVFFDRDFANLYNYLKNPLCNYFQGIESVSNNGEAYQKGDNKFCFRSGTTDRAYFTKYDTTSLEDFKTMLQEKYEEGNPVTVWYTKVEYTDIPITDTTLINQLNDIYNNAHSYNGTTNITTTYASGNEQMYLDIEALAKEDIPDLTDYVKNTNYASSSKGGVIKVDSASYNVSTSASGQLISVARTYQQYNNMQNNSFISKGTLENVITGKNLADKNYVDTAIATAITNTLGGSY